MIQSVYSVVKLRIKCDGAISDVFSNNIGVKQGEPLSPLLFLFFINDIAEDLRTNINENSDFVLLDGFLMYLLLFADDTVLFGKTPESLQLLLDKLLIYCKKWKIEVNKEKTEVVVFRKGWQPVNYRWFYDNTELKIVNSYIYLGVLFHYNGKFQQTQKRLAEQGGRALSSLLNTLKAVCVSPEQQCAMFDSLVSSVINYGSEVWGFHHAKEIETIHNRFCRSVLKVPKNTSVCCVIGDLGHLPMYIVRKQKLLKYWLKIITKKNIY